MRRAPRARRKHVYEVRPNGPKDGASPVPPFAKCAFAQTPKHEVGAPLWENPEDDLRGIGAVPRRSARWERLYGERTVIERMFNSVKRSRILNRHQLLSMKSGRARRCPR